jgi:hypothetical protein
MDEENPMSMAGAARAMRHRIEVMHKLTTRLEHLCSRMDALSASEENHAHPQPVINVAYGGTNYTSSPHHRITELFKELTTEEIRQVQADINAIAKEFQQ